MRALTQAWLVVAITAVASWCQPPELLGHWQSEEMDGETRILRHLALDGDGHLTMVMDGTLTTEELGEGSQALFPQGLQVHASGTGVWTADGDSLRLTIAQVQLSLDGQSIGEWIRRLTEQLIQEVIADSNIPEDQVPAFEQMLREQLATQLDPLAGEMTADLVDDFEGSHALAYTVADDVLVTVSSDGDTTEWRRGPGQSAVAPRSWGQVKSRWTAAP